MSFKIGSLVAIFFLAGVFIFLAIPILVTWIDRIRFARRFEGLVRRGLIVPVLIRRADGKANTRRRVTAQALMDAWVNEATLGGDLQNWKVRFSVTRRLLQSINMLSNYASFSL